MNPVLFFDDEVKNTIYRVGPWIVLGLFLLILIHASSSLRIPGSADGPSEYIPAARRFLQGCGAYSQLSSHHNIGWSWALAGGHLLFGTNLFVSGKVISVISTLIFLLFFYLLSRRMFGDRTTFFTLLLVVVSPVIIDQGIRELKEAFTACLYTLSVFFLLGRDRIGIKEIFLSGTFAGFAISVRWTGLFLVVFVAAGLLLINPYRFSLKRNITYIILFTVFMLISASPMLNNNYQLFGNPFYNRYNTSQDATQPFSAESNMFINSVLTDGLNYIYGMLTTSIANLFDFTVRSVHIPFGYLAIPGWILMILREPRRRQVLFLLLYVVVFTFFLTIVYKGSDRTLFPIAPFSALAAIYFIHIVFSEIAEIVSFKLFKGEGIYLVLLIILFFLLSSSVFWSELNTRWFSDERDYTGAARLLKRLDPRSDKKIVGVRNALRGYWAFFEHTDANTFLTQDITPNGLSYFFLDGDGEFPKYELNPLILPDIFEPIYYKSSGVPGVLYRVLQSNDLIQPAAIIASTHLLEETRPEFVSDSQVISGWSSTVQSNPSSQQWIVLDLGAEKTFNRLWLLPEINGEGFPRVILLEVSSDQSNWEEILEANYDSPPGIEIPQVFSFQTIKARFIRIVGNQLQGEDGNFRMALREARVSLGVDKVLGQSDFVLERMINAPEAAVIYAEIRNIGDEDSAVVVAFYQGMGKERLFLNLVESPVVSPGEVGLVPFSTNALSPGPTEIYAATDLYPCRIPEPERREFVVSVDVPLVMTIDNFEYSLSPVDQGWVPGGKASGSIVQTAFDSDLDSQVLEIRSPAGTQFRLDREVDTTYRSILALKAKAQAEFVLYVKVLTGDGVNYTIQYSMDEGISSFDNTNKVLFYHLGNQYIDGNWHTIELDLGKDLYTLTGENILKVETFTFRGGTAWLDDLEIKPRSEQLIW